MKRILSGITPSGDARLHIGNYLGAVRQFIDLARENECFLMVADLHALTTVQDKETLQKNVETLYTMISQFVEQNKNVNRDQMKQLGFSLDWTRYHYSLEPSIVKTVFETFFKLHKDDLVYRDDRLLLIFCPCASTTRL